MTAVASYPQLNNVGSSLLTSTPQSARSVSDNGKVRSGKARIGQKRTLTPRASLSLGPERPNEREEEERSGSQAGTPNNQSRSWLRRLSSRDSSRTPISRPCSAAISNGSVAAFSQAGSTTPIFSGSSLPPNKLVKRSSSVRSGSGSPFQSSGSRLPVPVFRRPATSHERSASMQQRHSGADQSDHMSIDEDFPTARDSQLRQYFTPKVASGAWPAARRRSSSGIPNPIKRVYPDRKYTPMLVSARTPNLKPAQLEIDDSIGSDDEGLASSRIETVPNAASSPLPVQTAEFEEGQTPRRSFSIGNLLSSGPQPLWRRPTQNRAKSSGSKLLRRGRVVSAPQTTMGNSISGGNATDSERPAKRRDLTDRQRTSRSIPPSSSSNQYTEADKPHEIQLNLGDTPRSELFNRSHSPSAEASLSHAPSPAALLQHRPLSAARPARVSAAHSEIASTVDSDSEYRSLGDDSTDQSDAVYDSYRTRTTRSSSGRRGPHIEKIFDESPPTFSSGRSTKLRDLLNDGGFAATEFGGQYRHSTIDEEESSISTPVRSLRDNSVTSTPSARPGAQQLFQSSPPIPTMPDLDDIDWDAFDDDPAPNGLDTHHHSPTLFSHPTGKSLPFRFGSVLQQPHSASSDVTPLRQNGGNTDRTNLFDWSESQPSPGVNHSPPRPKTMHGKKGSDNRGSRATGRRAPSGMHARSHSVPVVPDAGGRRNNVMANKFGTWGVGSKGVTEDWGEDFDFDDPPAPIPESLDHDERRIDSGHEMFVPQPIREQQQNVVANIGLLREWGLLIEELKELRIRAVALDMMDGPYAKDWQEVDAMIELADQETEEQTLEPRRTPPSSPSFDFGAFEETTNTARARGQSTRLSDAMFQEGELSMGFTLVSPHVSTSQHSFTARARKDSEAVARSVIEALQSKRSVSDPTTLSAAPHSKKLPFDTATLRHIVPYVDRLKRKVKEGLRETEGLRTSPQRNALRNLDRYDDDEDGEPALRSIFNEPRPSDEVARRRSRRNEAVTDHDGSEGPSTDQRSDLANRMQSMNLPR